MGRLLRQLSPRRGAMAANAWPLARALARPYQAWFPRLWEELDSAAALALVESASRFEPAHGVKFRTFARARILGALRDCLRDEAARPRALPLDGLAAGDEPGRPDPPTPGDQARDLDRLLGGLPPQHAAVCRLIYGAGLRQCEAARLLGLGRPRIVRVHQQALQYLRDREASPRG